MNAERANQWLRLVANISVVAGIIFLVVEIRQNTESQDESRKLAAANAYQARANHVSTHLLANAHSPEMVEAIVSFEAAGGEDQPSDAFATLSPQDQHRIRSHYLSLLIIYDNNTYQFQNGYLSEVRYHSIDARAIQAYMPVWDALGFNHGPLIQKEINRLQNQ